jgi:hypothetical protein
MISSSSIGIETGIGRERFNVKFTDDSYVF